MITTKQFKQIKLFVLYPQTAVLLDEAEEVATLIRKNKVAQAVFEAMLNHQMENLDELKDVLNDVKHSS
tara:strand:+ start:176 stop:382 length:207 start_codon:yes stop_codon:yes gene_type:complete